MAVIALYAPDETDFSTLGLGALTPSTCTVSWQAAGAYELTLTQPIDETNRWAQLQNGCIISAPVPVRESPLYEYSVGDGGSGSVTRNIWQVVRTSVGLNMRTGYGTGHKIIRHYKNGTQVIELGRMMVGSRMWIHCTTVEGGETGYMSTKYLELVETKTETISGGRPENQRVLQLTQSRRQLFRVYSTEQDSDAGVVTVKARHVFYDLAGNMLNEEYSPEKISGAAAAQEVFAHLKNAHDFSLYTEGLTQGSVTGEYAYKNPVEILLDPDEGIVSQCGCQIIRDNFDVHLIDDIESDMGVTVRRGKNLAGVTATTDESDVVTQIKPCGKDADGNEFWLADAEGDGRYVNSAHINEYAVVRTVKKDYDVSLVKKDEDNETTFRDNASGRSAARAKLRELAEQDFADGADLPSYGLEVDFVLLQDVEGYEQYAGLQAVHPYDTVTVIDSLIGLTARLRVTGYEWDALTGQYADVTLGDLSSLEQTVYSYNLPDGGISGTKIAPGTASGDILRTATIQYAKISVAAIEQLSAEAIVALTAHINEIVAEKLTTDELYAAYAELIALKAGTITAENIETDALAAELARITVLAAGSASFDRATVAHLVAEAMNLQFGTAGQVFIQNLAVEYAQMVGAAIGNLCIKASDGSYYSLDVSADGSVTATPTTVTEGEISAGETGSGRVILETNITAANLSTSNLLATYALVNKIDAARIDVAELFAQRAFIDLLTTSNIFGGKSLTMIAGQVEQNTQDIANQAQDFASTVTRIDADMESLQGQIDGSITTWFYEVAPTNENEPAVNWTSTDEKNLHLGDLYYDTVTGYCYRWQVQNNAYSWQRITDTDVTKALSDAASAQDTADAKRRVFVSTPVPPYDVGDLWVQGDGGDILRCNAQKISGQSYAAGDWVKASKYTDDTLANQALTLAGGGVASTDVEFYLSTSKAALTGGSWQTVAPEWVDGKYMWMRVKTTLMDGTARTSDPTCIAGATGATGATGPQGVSITAVTEEYYLSTSKTSPTGGSWQSTQPAWMMGTYVWTRVKISYNNGNVSYTEPYCDTSWEVVNDVSIYTSAEPPKAPIPDGKLWVDTAQNPNVIRRWLGQDVSTERDYTASASGNPVETPPGTASFDSIQSVLLPVQAGSGDPSPDNIRPISGRTSVNLTRCGKNLLPPAVEKTIVKNGVTFTSDGQGRYTINGTATGANVTAMIDLAEPITIGETAPYCHLLNPVANPNISFSFIRPDGTQITWFTTSSVNRIAQIPLLAGETISKINLYLGKDKTADNFTLTPMFCIDDVPAAFAPYQGDTYAADFGHTVYGGTLDWLTGVLTVEWGLISSYAGEALSGEWISDRDVYSAGATPTTGAQIAYKLATPITIQLPPATVTALKGVNTLHTDADSVSVAYTASGWEIVNDLSEINDVSNRLLAQQAAAQQAIDQLATAITVDSDGAHFYKPGYRAQNEVRIDQDSVDILVGGSVNSSFVAGGLILGNYMLWHPEAAGGLAFNLI